MSWVEDLKVTIINKDFDKTVFLLKKIPKLNTEEALNVQSLISHALEIAKEEKNVLSKEMLKLKDIKKYIS